MDDSMMDDEIIPGTKKDDDADFDPKVMDDEDELADDADADIVADGDEDAM